jgi:hypothetical protein
VVSIARRTAAKLRTAQLRKPILQQLMLKANGNIKAKAKAKIKAKGKVSLSGI